LFRFKHIPAAVFTTVLCALTLCSCTEPLKEYDFKDFGITKGWHDNVSANLSLDIKEGMAPGKIYICAQILNNEKLAAVDSLPVFVAFISPDSKKYFDTVNLPLNVTQVEGVYRKSGRLIEIQWPYMNNIDVNIPGRWKIILRHLSKNNSVYDNIIGIGVSCK
jgi:hypothetical protein